MEIDDILSDKHWYVEGYVQRIDSKIWKKILLAERDKIIVRGVLRTLVAKNLGYGVVEIRKKPKTEVKG